VRNSIWDLEQSQRSFLRNDFSDGPVNTGGFSKLKIGGGGGSNRNSLIYPDDLRLLLISQ
jgi:hypothetical protein